MRSDYLNGNDLISSQSKHMHKYVYASLDYC